MTPAIGSTSTSTAPRVSVVIPVRNDATNLRRCLDALNASTYSDFEVIVVDDGSSDESAFVAKRRGARVVRSDLSGGPAAARNAGVEVAHGEIIFFLDSDVCVHPDTLEQLVATFDEDFAIDAVFGSYDATPASPSLVSQFKNLFHHFVHQRAKADAGTFWTGCGAVRHDVFTRLGGFDTERYTRPCIEDIEFGVRMKRSGHHIVLNKAVQATHLKRWTLRGMVHSDVFDRGVPWTRLILRERNLPNDLNLGLSQRISALLAGLFVLATLVTAWRQPLVLLMPVAAIAFILLGDAWTARFRLPRPLAIIAGCMVLGTAALLAWLLRDDTFVLLLPLTGIMLLNVRFYAFFLRRRGLLFTCAVLPLHVLYYLYSSLALVIGIWQHLTSRSDTPPAAPKVQAPPLPMDAPRREVA